ncbi:MAG: IS630 family transposase [Methanobrevibacter sp.]|nr:IS630 family transposase [Candidatus Methanovirga australis]
MKPWTKRMWCINEIDEEYRNRMYDVLDLYEKEYDPFYPVICFDEKHKKLIEDVRERIPIKPGKPEKYDYEYKRNGTANIFVAVDFKGGKRDVTVTDRRTKKDFAHYMKHLVDDVFTDAHKLIIVLDNLNTHFKKSIIDTFEKEEATRLLNKLEFHYTPKHASWLNIAEIEINVMDMECTGGRMKNKDYLMKETMAWCSDRNEKNSKINWNFTKKKADKKLSKYYI